MPTDTVSEILIYSRPKTPCTQETFDWLIAPATVDAEKERGTGLESLQAELQPATQDTQSSTANAVSATLILPAEAALIKTIAVPSAKQQHIRAAVPHLIEEWTAAELEDLHIAFGDRSSAGSVPVVAIDRDALQRWLALSETPFLRADRVFVDALLLPVAPQTLTLALDGERALLRWSDQQAGAIEISALDCVLVTLLNHEEINTIDVITPLAADCRHAPLLQDVLPALARSFSLNIEYRSIGRTLLDFLAEQLASLESSPPLNLRQGEFAPPNEHSINWRRWRPVAIVAGVCLALQISLNLILGLTLNHQADSTHAQSEKLYRELFPQDKRLVNLLQQTRAHLDAGSLSGHASFPALFSYLTKAIQNLSNEHPPQLRALQYDANTGDLQVEVVVDNIQTLDDQKKRLGIDGITTKVLHAANENGALVSRISLMGH